ncbi:hypothetical protein HU200_034589 [Digitaria exilis]|uniref:Disease resistance R13L4/SHOC-2-like LRR domain-containing protein n=1 Tax=Digitaria exilis TaxID=1010633 RepID=A0A835BJC8_9POAL|nr:hypothetical protein HU200_034589 [Digitaria exilis]
MAPAASGEEEEEEQGKEEEYTVVSSASTEPEEQDVDSTVEADRRMKMNKIGQASISLGSCRTLCSEMLEAARRGRVTGDFELRCLEFLVEELNYIVACLTALSPDSVDNEMIGWLGKLADTASGDLSNALSKAHPPRRTLLRRAVQCFCRSDLRDPSWLLFAVSSFYLLAERHCRYMHLPAAISRLALPHQAQVGLPGKIHLYGYIIMFPYGYKFEKDRLVHQWLCEASVSYFDSAEEADRYFSDLVHRNTITQAADNSRRGNVDETGAWQWNVDHRQHQLLASKSAEMGIAFTSHTLSLLVADNKTNRIPRRLALHHDVPNIQRLLRKVDLSQTRSLAVSGSVSIGVPIHKFVNLVVLDVEGWENFGDEDILLICKSKMFFLVHLSIRRTRVSKLPPDMNELYSLQVLDASYTQVTELPFGDFKATRLRRLDLRGTPISKLTLPKQTLELQDSLHTLLLGDEGMINSAETAATILPHDIQRFRGLSTLATVDLNEQPASFIRVLGELRYLKVLAITWSYHQSCDRDYCEALVSSIKRCSDLRSLTIHCGLGCSMEFLGSLSSSSRPRMLEKFKVMVGRFAVVPRWFHGLIPLSFVQITVCKLEDLGLGILRFMPKLKCLVLVLDFIPREAIVIKNGGFDALQRFSIECSVPWLSFESRAMPVLTCLQLNLCACPSTPISVPLTLGISNLYRLTEVALFYNARDANSSIVKRTVRVVRKEVAQRNSKICMPRLFINGIEQDDIILRNQDDIEVIF